MGQGNRFLEDVYRDSSCLIIRDIKKKGLGMIISLNVSDLSVQKVVVAFVDDNNLVTDGEDTEEKIDSIITTYDDLHLAIGRHIE